MYYVSVHYIKEVVVIKKTRYKGACTRTTLTTTSAKCLKSITNNGSRDLALVSHVACKSRQQEQGDD